MQYRSSSTIFVTPSTWPLHPGQTGQQLVLFDRVSAFGHRNNYTPPRYLRHSPGPSTGRRAATSRRGWPPSWSSSSTPSGASAVTSSSGIGAPSPLDDRDDLGVRPRGALDRRRAASSRRRPRRRPRRRRSRPRRRARSGPRRRRGRRAPRRPVRDRPRAPPRARVGVLRRRCASGSSSISATRPACWAVQSRTAASRRRAPRRARRP